jgi:hypothetical protein
VGDMWTSTPAAPTHPQQEFTFKFTCTYTHTHAHTSFSFLSGNRKFQLCVDVCSETLPPSPYLLLEKSRA